MRSDHAPDPQAQAGAALGRRKSGLREKTEDYGWIVQAMADCDVAAKHKLDTLHFLIIPVTATGVSLPGWSPTAIGAVGDAVTLLHSSDTMIGLRNRALALYQKPLTFAVSDPRTKTVYKWKPSGRRDHLTTPRFRLARAHARIRVPGPGQGDRMGPHDQSHQGNLLLDQSADSRRAP